MRRQLKISHITERSSPSSYTKSLAFWWAITGLNYYDHYVEDMQKVTLADIYKYVTKWLIGRNHLTGILLSPEGAKTAGLKDTSEQYAKKFLKAYYPTKYGVK